MVYVHLFPGFLSKLIYAILCKELQQKSQKYVAWTVLIIFLKEIGLMITV